MRWNLPFAPEQASTMAANNDNVFYLILALTVVFTVAVGIAVVFLAIRYRHGSKVDRSNVSHHNIKLELGWSLPPLFLGLIVFFFGAQLYVRQRIPPKDCYEVSVIGKQWMWHMQHPNGIRENNTLHIPIGIPVRVTMISQDVIHAFYIPEFRTQFYTVPGRYTSIWFNATKAGTYHLFCNLYCGTQHSEMGGSVIAMEQKDFNRWLASGGESGKPETLLEQGAKTFNKYVCSNCHTNVDTVRGPTLVGIAGTKRTMEDGSQVTADRDYLRESILHPYEKLTKGYPDRSMPEYAGQISEEEILGLTAYIQSLNPSTATPAPGGLTNVPVGSVSAEPTTAVGALAKQNFGVTAPVKDEMAVGALNTQNGDKTNR
jgi:cytochrome c oxidase subunit II